MRNNVEIARQYLEALEHGADRTTLAQFFQADVVQHEFPNRLMPTGATRDLAALLDGAERGKQGMSLQRFEITTAVGVEDLVVLEVQWTGTLAHALGALPAGAEMRARFAVFLEFRDGKISKQRNYDCFEPW